MEHVFGWIGQIFQTLLRFFPWLVIVPATSAGVAFVHGRRIKEWKPGLHWYWPLVTTYKLMMTVRQTQRIQSKVVMTKDLKTVTVGALVTYHIDDIVSATRARPTPRPARTRNETGSRSITCLRNDDRPS